VAAVEEAAAVAGKKVSSVEYRVSSEERQEKSDE
jgi:hypothetical protein